MPVGQTLGTEVGLGWEGLHVGVTGGAGQSFSQCPEATHLLAAAAPIRPLAWEPPYAAGAGLEKDRKKKTKKKSEVLIHVSTCMSLENIMPSKRGQTQR